MQRFAEARSAIFENLIFKSPMMLPRKIARTRILHVKWRIFRLHNRITIAQRDYN